jgi:hypothetical protein
MFGKVENPKNEKLPDLSLREFATFAPLIVLAVWIGIYPKPFLDRLQTSVQHVVLRVSPEYTNAYAECNTTPKPEQLASAAGQFLAAAPCGPDGQPLTEPARSPAQPPVASANQAPAGQGAAR